MVNWDCHDEGFLTLLKSQKNCLDCAIRATTGDPNTSFGNGDEAFWTEFALNLTRLQQDAEPGVAFTPDDVRVRGLHHRDQFEHQKWMALRDDMLRGLKFCSQLSILQKAAELGFDFTPYQVHFERLLDVFKNHSNFAFKLSMLEHAANQGVNMIPYGADFDNLYEAFKIDTGVDSMDQLMDMFGRSKMVSESSTGASNDTPPNRS